MSAIAVRSIRLTACLHGLARHPGPGRGAPRRSWLRPRRSSSAAKSWVWSPTPAGCRSTCLQLRRAGYRARRRRSGGRGGGRALPRRHPQRAGHLSRGSLWWIIKLAPIGTAGLIGRAVADYGWNLLAPLAVFTVDVYVGCLIVLFVVYPLLARGARPEAQPVLRRRLAGHLVRVRVPQLGRHPAAHPAGGHPEPRCLARTTRRSRSRSERRPRWTAARRVYPALAAITVAQLFGVQLGVTDYLLIAFVVRGGFGGDGWASRGRSSCSP